MSLPYSCALLATEPATDSALALSATESGRGGFASASASASAGSTASSSSAGAGSTASSSVASTAGAVSYTHLTLPTILRV